MNQTVSHPLLRALDTFLEGHTGGWFINIVVIPSLVLISLLLPPIALPSRLLSMGYTSIPAANGGSVTVSDGTQLYVPPGVAKTQVSIRLTSQTLDAFLRSRLASDLPTTLEVKSPMYAPAMQGTPPSLSILSIPIPDGADPLSTLTVFGYVGKRWIKLPFQIYIDDQRIETYLNASIPEAVVVAQTQAQTPTLTGDLSGKSQIPSQLSQVIAEVTPGGFRIEADGSISGNITPSPATDSASPYQVYPTVTNVHGELIRGDWVDAMIADSYLRTEHVRALVDLTTERLYPGINIDYQNVAPDNRIAFTVFVKELGAALRAKNKMLSIRLPMPSAHAVDNWDTGAYDWAEIGQHADVVTIPIHVTRDAYIGDNPVVQSYLSWAVGRIDQFKLQIAISMLGRDEFGSAFAPVGFGSALKLMGPVTVSGNTTAGEKVTFDLQRLREAGGLKADAVTGHYSFTYRDDKGQSHNVLMENAESLSRKLALALQYNLRGVVLRDLGVDAVDPRVWDALRQYRDGQAPAFKGVPAIVWRVGGQSVGKSSPNDPRHTWTVPNQPGDEKIEAVLSLDSGQSAAGSAGVANVQIVRPAPTRAPVAAAPPAPPAQPAAPAAAAVSNFRGKNLFGFGIQTDWTNKDRDTQLNHVSTLGFSWVKIQVRWCDISGGPTQADVSSIEDYTAKAGARGIKVMASVVCAPGWSRAGSYSHDGPPDNLQHAADFMGGVAGYFCPTGSARGKLHGIEVWNETNLRKEWDSRIHPLTAKSYVDMLRLTYQKIKQTCPDMVVVSAAMTPTGWNDGITAIDDAIYLEQLYQAGLKDVSDAIGAHPSGYNVPALCNIQDPACNRPGASFQPPFQGRHRSWSFLSTMLSYRAIMVKYGDGNKQIWPTEFGWPYHTGGMCGSGPCHPAGSDNNVNDVGDWYVQAFQWAKQQGWVGAMFAWQLDFDRGELDAFKILGKPAYEKLRAMPK